MCYFVGIVCVCDSCLVCVAYVFILVYFLHNRTQREHVKEEFWALRVCFIISGSDRKFSLLQTNTGYG